MKTTSRFAIAIAWVLLALVVTASVDKVPDNPAVLKQFSVRAAVEYDHQERGSTGDAPIILVTLAPAAPAVTVASLLAVEEIRPGGAQPESLRLATDPSPPYLHS